MSINGLVSSNQFAIKEYIVQFYDDLVLEMFIRQLKLDDLAFDFIDAEEASGLDSSFNDSEVLDVVTSMNYDKVRASWFFLWLFSKLFGM